MCTSTQCANRCVCEIDTGRRRYGIRSRESKFHEPHSKRFHNHQNVTEEDGSVQCISPHRLHRYLADVFWVLEDLKKVTASLLFVRRVFWQVPPSLRQTVASQEYARFVDHEEGWISTRTRPTSRGVLQESTGPTQHCARKLECACDPPRQCDKWAAVDSGRHQ
jgi:hypothetical protein